MGKTILKGKEVAGVLWQPPLTLLRVSCTLATDCSLRHELSGLLGIRTQHSQS